MIQVLFYDPMLADSLFVYHVQVANVGVPFLFKDLVDWLNVGGFDTPQETIMTFGTALVLGCKLPSRVSLL